MAVWAALVVLAVLALIFFWPGGPQADLRRIDGQNVLLVTIDTLRADALSAYGGPASTPALDRLAAEGVRFDFAHAHAVLTLPSHASILTGEYPVRHGVRENSGYRLPRDARTIATVLKRTGYATAAFVAAFPLHSRFGLNAGFDVYDERFGDGFGPVDLSMPERPASAVVPLARDWIAGRGAGAAVSGQATQPWFVWVHVFDPHAPYRPSPPFDEEYAGKPYYGEVAATDAALAPLLEDVRNSVRPTLVIVTSDHGEGLGDHGEEAHGIFAYESTLRVPLIMANLGGNAAASAPGRPGEVSQVAARHVDILPTILSAVGQTVPSDLPGRTLLPRRERKAGAAPRTTYFEAMSGMLNHGWAPLAGVLVDRDKFIDLPLAERYDLATDPGEGTNLFGHSPERDRTLAAALGAFGPALPGERATEDPDTAARLRALGYVSGGARVKVQYTEADDPKRLIDLDGAVHKALEAFGAGRLEEAAELYRQVIERRPDMEIAYRHLAFIDYQRGDIARAIEVLRRAVATGVTDARLQAQLGEYPQRRRLGCGGHSHPRAPGGRLFGERRRPQCAGNRLRTGGPHCRRTAGVRALDRGDARQQWSAREPGSARTGAGRRSRRQAVPRSRARGVAGLVACARRVGRRRLRARGPGGRLRGVVARRDARPEQCRRPVQPGRQPGARRPDGCRAALS